MENLIYTIKENAEVVLVYFKGEMNAEEIPMLEKLFRDLKKRAQPNVIFNFRDVSGVKTQRAFALMLNFFRSKNKCLALVCLRPELKTGLLKMGVIKERELFNTIREAWDKMSPKT